MMLSCIAQMLQMGWRLLLQQPRQKRETLSVLQAVMTVPHQFSCLLWSGVGRWGVPWPLEPAVHTRPMAWAPGRWCPPASPVCLSLCPSGTMMWDGQRDHLLDARRRRRVWGRLHWRKRRMQGRRMQLWCSRRDQGRSRKLRSRMKGPPLTG